MDCVKWTGHTGHLARSRHIQARRDTGAVLLPDGDTIFNYSKKGTVRMGLCGEIRWTLPYQTNHSINLDDTQTLWISDLRVHTE